jgi:hypothetical protein
MSKSTGSENVSILRDKLSNSVGLPFWEVLPETTIEQALKDAGMSYRKRLFCPIVTIWTWVCQVLSKDKSCKNAVSNVVSHLSSSGVEPPSTRTGAYCKARKRLKESVLAFLFRLTGKHLHEPNPELWCGRRVIIADGSTVTMDDTQTNQEQYPQPGSQAEGCGFPMANIVALFCLKTGALLEAVIGALSTHELNLFRSLYERLQPDDVLLGDRLYGSYADICLLQSRGVDCVFRMHQSRKTDFRRGKILGIYDHVVEWIKPKACPPGLDPLLFAQLPESIKVREVRYLIETKGFRTQKVTLVTTLLDAELYSKEALAELYHMRWSIEIDLRHLKTTMRMEHLSSKTPQMARKEFYMHLLAYNLIRTIMSQSVTEHDVKALELSFQATIQHHSNFRHALASADAQERKRLYNVLLYLVSKERLLIRPGRVEPRLKKKRPKSYGWLQQPRKKLKKQLAA